MSPQRFFAQSLLEVRDQNSGFLLGPVFPDQDNPTHQMAIATNGDPGQETATVLTADMDPDNDDLVAHTVSLVKGSETQPQDVHVGHEEGDDEETLDLRLINTVVGEASLRLFMADQPGIFDGLLNTRAYGSLMVQLYVAKYSNNPEFVLNGRDYAELQEEYPVEAESEQLFRDP